MIHRLRQRERAVLALKVQRQVNCMYSFIELIYLRLLALFLFLTHAVKRGGGEREREREAKILARIPLHLSISLFSFTCFYFFLPPQRK